MSSSRWSIGRVKSSKLIFKQIKERKKKFSETVQHLPVPEINFTWHDATTVYQNKLWHVSCELWMNQVASWLCQVCLNKTVVELNGCSWNLVNIAERIWNVVARSLYDPNFVVLFSSLRPQKFFWTWIIPNRFNVNNLCVQLNWSGWAIHFLMRNNISSSTQQTNEGNANQRIVIFA